MLGSPILYLKGYEANNFLASTILLTSYLFLLLLVVEFQSSSLSNCIAMLAALVL